MGKKAKIKQGFKPVFDWVFAKELYGAGLPDTQIASTIGCTREAVRNWRHKNKLVANFKPRLISKEDFEEKLDRQKELNRVICSRAHSKRFMNPIYRKKILKQNKEYKKKNVLHVPNCIGCGKRHEVWNKDFRKGKKIFVPAYCRECKEQDVLNELFVKELRVVGGIQA